MDRLRFLREWYLARKKPILRSLKFLNAFLTLLATMLAALASWFSYRAAGEANATAKQANATAAAAYSFTVRTANDSSMLQQPSLSVTGGKITQGETEGEGWVKITKYSVELHIRNSGARDAAPAWITFGNDRNSGAASRKLANIPKDQEIAINFDVKVEDSPNWLKDMQAVAVGLRYLDTAPEYQLEKLGSSAISFHPICSSPKIQLLATHRMRNEAGTNELALSMGPSFAPDQLANGGRTSEINAASTALNLLSAMKTDECQADKPKQNTTQK